MLRCAADAARGLSGTTLQTFRDGVQQRYLRVLRSAEYADQNHAGSGLIRKWDEIRLIEQSFVRIREEDVLTLSADQSYQSVSQFGFSS